MKFYPRRAGKTAAQEARAAVEAAWVKWASDMVALWDAIDALPAGDHRDQLTEKARELNDAMWQLDPDRWELATGSWQKHWRNR